MTPAWRIDRKIPIRAWIAVGGMGVVAILLGEAMLIHAVAAYQGPLAQYAKDHYAIDEAQYRALPPVPAPSGWAYSEGAVGNLMLAAGVVLAALASIVRLLKVRLRWLVLRSLGALLVAFFSGVTAVYMVRPDVFQFMYVNSGDCVGGCYYIPQPIGGWLSTVTIAFVLSGIVFLVLTGIAIVRSLSPRSQTA